MKKDLRSLLIIAVVILIFTVPYLNMAYHVDANWFMDIAEQIIKDPLRAYTGNSDLMYFSGVPLDFYFVYKVFSRIFLIA